ncbi:ABC transporter substrate-binding protein [Conexibacter sp. JD483]|uniref:ABC transporter substrate-binding protein n=1 Tax=unclassified Conexibacter TaxID=2627773 RepID=UPI002722F31C|nr:MULTISPECIES: ABC transporter substrate-binding protein [unclassified Conexibacter]MDO8188013.1 ABC transporter substrate-binding protein [Conexibacter sp. CPCC 205706]MDO8200896.1 ABC transporter substrate-binding protein [Conexibacter sp. CPCC 205762]MDR9370371.1 ABC transporter substrate-binding protein [Conexibacter sp. JD483]
MPDDQLAPSVARARGRLSRADFLRGAGLGAIALTSSAVLAACGGQDSGGSSAASTSAGTSTGGGAAAADVRGTVTFFGWDVADTSAGLGKGFAAAADAWSGEHPGASVRFDGVPFDKFVASATTRARAGKLGDLVEMLPGVNHASIFPALVATAPSDWGPLADELSGWSAGVIDPADPNQVAGVPIGAQGVVWYYNKALFRRAGLDPEAPPRTWAEFTAAARALKARGITPIGMSGVDSNLAWWAWSAFSPQAFPTVEDVLKVRTGDIPLDDPRFLRTLEPLKQTFDEGWWNDDFKDVRFTDVEAAFTRGKVAMVPGLITSAMNWAVWDDKLGKDAYGVFAAPLIDGFDRQGQFFNPTLIYGIPQRASNPDASRSYVEYLASADGQTILLREAGQFPNRRDVDVEAVSGSRGAQQISDIVAELGGVDVAQNQFTAAAQGAALQKLTTAITGGDLEGFLKGLQQQQAQG